MKNRNNLIFVYYAALLLILASRQNALVEPPLVLRLIFIGLVVIPCIVTSKVCYPAIITMFLTISQYGFAYSYMPYMTYIYVFLTLIITIVSRKNAHNSPPLFLVVFLVYIFTIDLLTGAGNSKAHFPENISYCFFMLLLFFNFITDDDDDIFISQAPFTFAVTTIVLSLYFLINRNTFIQSYSFNSGLERSGWTDPNYFGMIIGMGTTISAIKIFDRNWKKNSVWTKIIFIAAVVLSTPTLVLNASRGAILSVLLSISMLLLYSRAKLSYKFFIIIVAVLGIVWLYKNQYFELLEYRIVNDNGTGSNRTEIWALKLNAFFNGSPFKFLSGYGYAGGCNITGRSIGFHNEYIAFFVDYGIIGIIFLFYMLLYPIKKVKNAENKPAVIVLIVYLLACFLTLEPFSLGISAFYTFYLYAIVLSKKRSFVGQQCIN